MVLLESEGGRGMPMIVDDSEGSLAAAEIATAAATASAVAIDLAAEIVSAAAAHTATMPDRAGR